MDRSVLPDYGAVYTAVQSRLSTWHSCGEGRDALGWNHRSFGVDQW